jgi:hypothetical protein
VSNLELGISNPKVDYALGHYSRELDRLSFQGTLSHRNLGGSERSRAFMGRNQISSLPPSPLRLKSQESPR